MINLSSFIAFHARRTPDRFALKYRGEESPMPSSISVSPRRRLVVSRGVGPGDVVAVLIKNSAAFLELVFATSHMGGVPADQLSVSADEVGYIVGNSGAIILIADEELADIAAVSAPVVLLDQSTQSTPAPFA